MAANTEPQKDDNTVVGGGDVAPSGSSKKVAIICAIGVVIVIGVLVAISGTKILPKRESQQPGRPKLSAQTYANSGVTYNLQFISPAKTVKLGSDSVLLASKGSFGKAPLQLTIGVQSTAEKNGGAKCLFDKPVVTVENEFIGASIPICRQSTGGGDDSSYIAAFNRDKKQYLMTFAQSQDALKINNALSPSELTKLAGIKAYLPEIEKAVTTFSIGEKAKE